jgi:hypothetical protein
MKKLLLSTLFLVALTATATAQTVVQIPVPPVPPVPVTIVCPNGTPTVSGTTITCPPPVIPPPITGRTKVYPSGGPDNGLIWAAAAKGPIELAASATNSTFLMPSGSPTLPPNADVYCDDGVTMTDMSGYGTNDVMLAITNPGIKIAGSGGSNACLFTMPNSYAKNIGNTNQSTNQYNHCLAYLNVTNPVMIPSVTGIRFDKCGGDAIYLNTATNITIQKNIITHPIRNGISPTDKLTNILIDSNDISLVMNANAGISDAIDVEPNSAAGFVNGITISNNNMHDLLGSAICFQGYNYNGASTSFIASVINNLASNTHPPPVGGYGAYDLSNPTSGMKITGSGNKYNGMLVKFP